MLLKMFLQGLSEFASPQTQTSQSPNSSNPSPWSMDRMFLQENRGLPCLEADHLGSHQSLMVLLGNHRCRAEDHPESHQSLEGRRCLAAPDCPPILNKRRP